MYWLGRLFTIRQALKAFWLVLGSFNVLSLLTLVRRPRRFWVLSKDMFGCFNNRVRAPTIPVRSIAEILPAGGEPLSLSLSLDMRAGISLAELVSLCALARVGKAKNILEIGTFTGVTAYHLARNTGDACRVFTMDLPQEFRKAEALRDVRRKGRRYTELDFIHERPTREKLGYAGTDVENKVVQIYADSSTYDYAKNFSQKFDLIFIDGSHDYDHVKIDSANALRWVAENGFVVWHDYKVYPEITWGVRKYVDELRQKYNIVRIAGTSLCVFKNTLPGKGWRAPDPTGEKNVE